MIAMALRTGGDIRDSARPTYRFFMQFLIYLSLLSKSHRIVISFFLSLAPHLYYLLKVTTSYKILARRWLSMQPTIEIQLI